MAASSMAHRRASGVVVGVDTGWGRSLGIATIPLAAGFGLVWLEVSLH